MLRIIILLVSSISVIIGVLISKKRKTLTYRSVGYFLVLFIGVYIIGYSVCTLISEIIVYSIDVSYEDVKERGKIVKKEYLREEKGYYGKYLSDGVYVYEEEGGEFLKATEFKLIVDEEVEPAIEIYEYTPTRKENPLGIGKKRKEYLLIPSIKIFE